jgi:hypothetical protein
MATTAAELVCDCTHRHRPLATAGFELEVHRDDLAGLDHSFPRRSLMAE